MSQNLIYSKHQIKLTIPFNSKFNKKLDKTNL